MLHVAESVLNFDEFGLGQAFARFEHSCFGHGSEPKPSDSKI